MEMRLLRMEEIEEELRTKEQEKMKRIEEMIELLNRIVNEVPPLANTQPQFVKQYQTKYHVSTVKNPALSIVAEMQQMRVFQVENAYLVKNQWHVWSE